MQIEPRNEWTSTLIAPIREKEFHAEDKRQPGKSAISVLRGLRTHFQPTELSNRVRFEYIPAKSPRVSVGCPKLQLEGLADALSANQQVKPLANACRTFDFEVDYLVES
jgi:hypothetical protein